MSRRPTRRRCPKCPNNCLCLDCYAKYKESLSPQGDPGRRIYKCHIIALGLTHWSCQACPEKGFCKDCKVKIAAKTKIANETKRKGKGKKESDKEGKSGGTGGSNVLQGGVAIP